MPNASKPLRNPVKRMVVVWSTILSVTLFAALITPLHMAAWNGKAEVIEVLVSRGADLNAKWELAQTGDGSWNALHITAIQGRTAAARVLVRCGTDVNGRTVLGETPLDVAVGNGHRELADLLRANGGVSGRHKK